MLLERNKKAKLIRTRRTHIQNGKEVGKKNEDENSEASW